MTTEPPPLGVDDHIEAVLARLEWMDAEDIWPNGPRYLWTDGFGVVLLVSLAEATGDERFLDRAEVVVADVDRVLGRRRGYRIGEAPDRGGQYFHYLTVWAFALGVLGRHRPAYRDRAIGLIRDVHPRFLVAGRGIWWKMTEDLSGPAPASASGHSIPSKRVPSTGHSTTPAGELTRELADMRELIRAPGSDLHITQDLGLGMMLWSTRWCRDEEWATVHRQRSLAQLDTMWINPPGYFCREPRARDVRFAFTNAGVALGLQAVGVGQAFVERLLGYFDRYRSGDHYDRDAITHVMALRGAIPGGDDPRVRPAGVSDPRAFWGRLSIVDEAETTTDTTDTTDTTGDRLERLRRRVVMGVVGLVVVVGTWLLGAAVLPRWWAQRMGDIIDGRLTLGSLLGITIGSVFTVLALAVVGLGWRVREGWRRALLTLVIVALAAAPNLMTLGIVLGDGNAAHAGERILDVDGPGFRGGTLVGTIIGVLVALAFAFLAASRTRNKRKAKNLKAQLDSS